MNRKGFKIFELKSLNTDNFSIIPLELKDFFDFNVKRTYFIYNVKDKTGSHAHRIEQEFFILLKGFCTVVIDRGYGLEEYKLKGPNCAVFIDNLVWHHFKDFSEDAILLALSSTNYNKERIDYIEDHNEFKDFLKSKKLKILLLGADSTLGQYLYSVLKDNFKIFLSTKETIDFLDLADLYYKIKKIQPDIIINSAAFNSVDDCEDSEKYKYAEIINGIAVGEIAKISDELDAIFVHFSTDYVFDGNKQEGYLEDDLPNPINKYGQTKLLGENLIKKYCKKFYIIRTSRLFGRKGKSKESKKCFVDLMLDLSEQKSKLDIVNAEVSSPTYAKDLSEKVKEILLLKKPFGIYHITNHGACSWYEFAKEIFKHKNINIKLNPVDSDFFKRPAKRPNNSVLISSKVEKLRVWQDALKDYLLENETSNS